MRWKLKRSSNCIKPWGMFVISILCHEGRSQPFEGLGGSCFLGLRCCVEGEVGESICNEL